MGKNEREVEQQSELPGGFVLSDLKWRPAAQT